MGTEALRKQKTLDSAALKDEHKKEEAEHAKKLKEGVAAQQGRDSKCLTSETEALRKEKSMESAAAMEEKKKTDAEHAAELETLKKETAPRTDDGDGVQTMNKSPKHKSPRGGA